MTYTYIKWDDLSVAIRLASIRTAGVAEFHAMIEINNAFAKAQTQYGLLEDAIQRLAKRPELKGATLVWKRFFVSDAVNQSSYLSASAGEALSVVQQPPLNGAKVSAWLYFAEDAVVYTDSDGTTVLKRPHYTHLYHTGLHERGMQTASGPSPQQPLPSPVEHQTDAIFDRYGQSLLRYGCTLESNCLRTWIFVQDVDVRYAGMVTARRAHFEHAGLTPHTHYIASTGIEGRYIYPDVLALMDAYAVVGIERSQIKYLQALTHLNPTYEYGVTFERGTSVDYGDRRHIFISGTASIDNRGEIVHPLDIEQQTARTFENIRALLSEADAGMNDIAYMIVYLRDAADYPVVSRFIEQNYPDIPKVPVLAPVCRPGWLVEVECMAIKMVNNKQFAAF